MSSAESNDEGPPAGARAPDTSVIVGALYALAADPTEWEHLLEALTAEAATPAEQPRLSAMVAGGEKVAQLTQEARLAHEFTESAQPAVWIISSADRQIAANAPAATSPLDALLSATGQEPEALRREVLRDARARLRGLGVGATVVSMTAKGARSPTFAYAIALAELPPVLRNGLKPPPGEPRGALAIIAPSTPSDTVVWSELTEAFRLTPAEVRLATRLCEGASLKDAAQDLNVSVNTVRNQLTAVFEKTGVNRQSELVRALSDLGPVSRPLLRPKQAREPDVRETHPPAETLRLPDGRRLVFREYGPPRGRPVLLFHGGLGASLLPPGTEEACERHGLRLVAPERPGVGGSDPHPAHSIGSVVDDLLYLADHLEMGVAQYCSLTSGSRFAMAMAARTPGAVSRVLMLSPRVPSEAAHVQRESASPMVALQRRIKLHPWIADSLFSIIRLRLSRGVVGRVMQRSAVSPGDAAWLAAHPETVDQITQALGAAMRVTSRGTAEEIRHGGDLTPTIDAAHAPPITVWLGAEDAYVTPADARHWLGERLTTLRTFPDIGNYLILKHWAEALAWLGGANDPEG